MCFVNWRFRSFIQYIVFEVIICSKTLHLFQGNKGRIFRGTWEQRQYWGTAGSRLEGAFGWEETFFLFRVSAWLKFLVKLSSAL